MKITNDSQADALYIELRPLTTGTAQCRELSEELTADYGPDGKLVGIEILDAAVVLGEELRRMVVEIAPVLAVCAD